MRRCATLWTGKKPVVEVILVQVADEARLDPGDLLPVLGASAFLLLPFGVRTDEEVGAEKFPARRTARRTASTSRHRAEGDDRRDHPVRLLYYANWHFGWITAEDLDFYHLPARAPRRRRGSIAWARAA